MASGYGHEMHDACTATLFLQEFSVFVVHSTICAVHHRIVSEYPQGHAGNQHNALIVESAGRLQECHAHPMNRTPWRRWILDGHRATVCKHPYGHLTICRFLNGSDDGVVPLLRDAPTGRLSGEHPYTAGRWASNVMAHDGPGIAVDLKSRIPSSTSPMAVIVL